MKNNLITLGLGLCAVLAFTSCKSSESAYKQAYERARQQELAERQAVPVETVVVNTQPTTTTPPAPAAGVRQERVSVVSGTNVLKDYSVVCGSFTVKANAEGLKDWLSGQGYAPVVVFSAEARPNPSYRVIVSTFDTYEAASNARDAFKRKYSTRPDFQNSWLLYRLR